MTQAIIHQIAKVEPQPGYRLLVTWTTGDRSPVDFSAEVNGPGIWSALHDEIAFAMARVSKGGRVLEWPQPSGRDGAPRIDVDADGLYQMAMEQRSPGRPARKAASVR